MNLNFIAVNEQNLAQYINVGIQSYKEHYLHLWENSDPAPFINAFLTKEFVNNALKDSCQLFYVITADQKDVGILNITLDAKKGFFLSPKNLLLNKIYLLKEHSASGIGSKALDFVHNIAQSLQKEVVWLYAMKRGKPMQFYKKHGYQIVQDAFIELPHVLEHEKEMWLMAKKM